MHKFAGWQTPLVLAPRALHPWLNERGSLTQRLKAHFPDFSVQVLRQDFARPHRDERRPLAAGVAEVATREVLLCSRGQALVFAHSVVKRSALRSGFHLLGRTGSRPLGALLFADPTIRRSALSFACLDRRHPLWQKANQACGPLPARLWARRSFFYAGQDALLVTEVFLPPAF
ncbi:chorismate--pyruvate lyase family protein [Chitinibacter tainanensis]|uniref:chorismate--pyruvate lyase family protein n=1 Tax=Chitinibacter tainanensis TaxID=230667 RepID=UPI0003FAC347|nr:chorismate lyase [Chitinibacter tainanensis]